MVWCGTYLAVFGVAQCLRRPSISSCLRARPGIDVVVLHDVYTVLALLTAGVAAVATSGGVS